MYGSLEAGFKPVPTELRDRFMTEQLVFVGTSGWTYDDWSGRFYPEKGFKGPERLSFYTTAFNTVEVNATFYRTPTLRMIASWNQRLGDSFHLVVKGTRAVTHIRRLADCSEQLQSFLERILQYSRGTPWRVRTLDSQSSCHNVTAVAC